MRFRNKKVEGIVIPICLPLPVMERFECEIKRMTKEAKPTRFISSMFKIKENPHVLLESSN